VQNWPLVKLKLTVRDFEIYHKLGRWWLLTMPALQGRER
jgi:hypothetical protein